MKILVTGGAGFIASHVVDLYLANGHEVVILDDLSTGRASNLNPAARFIHMDIRDPRVAEVFERERPAVVNHHAAQMDVRRSIIEPLFDADVNIVGSLNLLENTRNHAVQHFIYISSGGAAYGEPKYLPCDEEHPVDPICQYGASKHTVEHYLHMYRVNYGLEYTVLRYPNVYGPRQALSNPYTGVLAIFASRLLNDNPPIIYEDGQQQRDFVNIADLVRACRLAAEAPQAAGQVFNIGSGEAHTVAEIAGRMARVLDKAHIQPQVVGKYRAGDIRHCFADISRARQVLGYVPQVSLQTGMAELAAWLRVQVAVDQVAQANLELEKRGLTV